jgi:phosphoribosylformylglycinamidine (FGAM) synthase-like enzyme
MWQFAECIRGISDACRALETPVVSGNVSFYNETEGRAIYPTPTVGMVGILESDRDGCGLAFSDADLDIILLGETRDELGGSEWQQMFSRDALAAPPRVDLEREKRSSSCCSSCTPHTFCAARTTSRTAAWPWRSRSVDGRHRLPRRSRRTRG